jgi:iron complex outermembrane recepter protein
MEGHFKVRLSHFLQKAPPSALIAALFWCGAWGTLRPESLQAQGSWALEVRVVNAETAEPISGAILRFRPLERGGFTDALGVARFSDLPLRPLTVVVEHIGFLPQERVVTPVAGRTAEVVFELVSTPLHLAAIVVSGAGRTRGAGEVYQPTTSLSGVGLERALATSLPATLEGVPGFHMQYNGPGAASPSIRGMSGDRVLVLEDGNRTGDLYASASDHGVMVEPLTAQRIEVVRGPAGLLYGPNALGGVVNLVRDDIPRSRPERPTGTLSSQLESVSRGGSLGGSVVTPLPAGFALRGEATLRRMEDAQTPLGRLERTGLTSFDGSLGGSWVPDWGFAGLALRRYENRYGVPGQFQGVQIPGGHAQGVEVDTDRTTVRARVGVVRPLLGFFDGMEVDGALVRYRHDEIEALLNGEPVLGARFRQTSLEGKALARHDHALHDHGPGELRLEGAFGFALHHRSLRAGGVSPGTRSANELGLAMLGYEEFVRGGWRAQGGLRLDTRQVDPSRLDPIRVRTREREVVKEVTSRRFTGVSASLALLREVEEGWVVGASLARAYRPPAIEELYSDGPHLADFSFDIGSPGLEAEVGTGLDLFIRAIRPTLSLEVAAFANRVDGYIYYAQTGETVRVLRDGVEPRITPVYEARGDNALFFGGEGRLQWETPISGFVVDLTASYTRAERRSDGDALPYIPPLNGRLDLRYEKSGWFLSAGVNGASEQNRVPRPVRIGGSEENPQEPTAGFGLLNAGAGRRIVRGGQTHSLTLTGRNLTDRVWRDHLSRIKDVAPQPGRNLSLTYRLYF